MSGFKEIKEDADYFATIFNDVSSNGVQTASSAANPADTVLDSDKRIEKLCQIALETRKFEIELYWKRTTYYWAFIAADLAAFALVYTRKCAGFATFFIMAILALCGVVFSVGWFLANKGSKYWQENWEDHIGLLVSKYYGPIFKILRNPERGLINGSPFSVSKINQIISGFVAFVWGALLVFSILGIWGVNITTGLGLKLVSTIALVAICAWIVSVLCKYARSGTYSKYRDWKKKPEKKEQERVRFYMGKKTDI